MTRIAFFGHDAGDAAIRRRVRGFMDDGLDVTGFMMRRQDAVETGWENVDLGRTIDGKYVQRVQAVFAGARRAAGEREKLAAADVIYARNLDMLATAFLAKRLTGLKTPVVYEALDVHRLLTRNDPVGFLFRRIEGALLRRSKLLVVSSPAFLTHHFSRHYRGFRSMLIENRLAAGADYGPRPSRETPVNKGFLTIGWVGNLRCSRSLDLLLELASTFGDKVRIRLHGAPALKEVPDFYERIAGHSNVTYAGRYKAPEELKNVYEGLDVVWAGDFMEAGYNSLWLLPNRIYEGGYHATPPIAPQGTETARWIETRGVGFTEAENLSKTLADLVTRLIADRIPILERRSRLLALPDETFVQPHGEFKSMLVDVLGAERVPPPINNPQAKPVASDPVSRENSEDGDQRETVKTGDAAR